VPLRESVTQSFKTAQRGVFCSETSAVRLFGSSPRVFDENDTATHQQITRSPDVLGGKAIGLVSPISSHLAAGESVDEVASCLQATTEEGEAARDYWVDHPDEIGAQL
jgi:hypothetical protein